MLNIKEHLKQKSYKKLILIALGGFVVLLLCFYFQTDKSVIKSENQLNNLVNRVRIFYRNKPNAWGLNTYSAIQNNIVPEEMIYGRQIKNSLGKEVLLGANEFGNTIMPGNNKIAIVYKNLNKKECEALSTAKLSEDMKMSVNLIKIINSETHIFSWGGKYILPITSEKAREICQKDNDVLWEIYL